LTKHTQKNQELSISTGIFTAFLCALFGANAVAIKISLAGFGVFTAAGLRFSIAAVAITLWALFSRRSFYIPKNQFHHVIILALIFSVQLSFYYLGLSKSNASRCTLIVNFQPFFTLLLTHFFIEKEKFTVRKFLGILMGFLGVAFVFWEEQGITADFKSGDLLIFTGSFLWACNAVYVKRIINRFKAFQLVLYPMIFSIPLFFAQSYFFDDHMFGTVTLPIITAILYQSLVAASFGFVAWTYLLSKYEAVSIHSFIFIMPISGVFFGGIILGEPISSKILVALMFITGGILLIHFKFDKNLHSYLFYKG